MAVQHASSSVTIQPPVRDIQHLVRRSQRKFFSIYNFSYGCLSPHKGRIRRQASPVHSFIQINPYEEQEEELQRRSWDWFQEAYESTPRPASPRFNYRNGSVSGSIN